MIEVNKICENNIYQQCMLEAKRNADIDIEKNIKEVSKKAIEIAKLLYINTEIIERAMLFIYLGLCAQTEDYIKTSGVLAVRILTQLNEDEDTVGRVLMAIAGQGNNGNSINIFSAVILLANFIDLKSYLRVNRIFEELINSIKLTEFDIIYDKREIKYEINAYKNGETYKIIEYINRVIENCANVLNLKISKNKIVYIS